MSLTTLVSELKRIGYIIQPGNLDDVCIWCSQCLVSWFWLYLSVWCEYKPRHSVFCHPVLSSIPYPNRFGKKSTILVGAPSASFVNTTMLGILVQMGQVTQFHRYGFCDVTFEIRHDLVASIQAWDHLGCTYCDGNNGVNVHTKAWYVLLLPAYADRHIYNMYQNTMSQYEHILFMRMEMLLLIKRWKCLKTSSLISWENGNNIHCLEMSDVSSVSNADGGS